jgi:hypothetical protein
MRGSEFHRSRDQPKVFSIRIHGYLDGSWSDRLGGMQLTVLDRETDPLTELVGRLPDQSALMGILTTIYELGLPILAVNSFPEPRGAPPNHGDPIKRHHSPDSGFTGGPAERQRKDEES